MKKIILTLCILLLIVLVMLILVRKESVEEVMKEDIAEDHVRIDFLDIGQGDAALVTLPNDEQMLIDCAIDARVIEALGRVMPYYDRTIEYLLVTHPDADHYGGCIDVLRRFDVQTIVYNGFQKPESDMWHAFMEETRRFDYIEIDKPQTWEIASTSLHFLYPDHSLERQPNVPGETKVTGANNASIVLKISYGEQDVLLTGDAEEELEEYLLTTYEGQLDVEILKAGHHGSSSSSIQPFVSSTSPMDVIISSGKDNRYGHPSRRVTKRFEREDASIWRTDLLGDIIVILQEENYMVTSTQL